jgi:hypothetical protein
MKKIGALCFLSVLFLWFGAGCQTMPKRSVPDTLVPFTARHMEDFGEYLEKIQFFISRQVVLHRTIESETKDVTGTVQTIQVEKDMQRKGETQIFIEAPYRNDALLSDLLENCGPATLLCIAADITLETEFISTRSISSWKRKKPALHKRPVIFLLGR